MPGQRESRVSVREISSGHNNRFTVGRLRRQCDPQRGGQSSGREEKGITGISEGASDI